MAEERSDNVHELPQARLSAGGRLRAAREAAGLTLEQMAGETKIPVRMLTLVEAGDYAGLPGKAYATGFTRTCARALGLDEQELVDEVRRELGHVDQRETRQTPTFEPGDPARVPTARFAWAAAVAALVVIAAGLLLWRSYYSPAVTLPPLEQASAPAQAVAPMPAVQPTLAPLPAAVPVPAPGAVAPGVVPAAPPSMAAQRSGTVRPRADGAAAPGAGAVPAGPPAAGALPPAAAPTPSPASTAQF